MVATRGASITLNRVSKSYGHGAAAVSDISLTVERGEFLTLLVIAPGPNGGEVKAQIEDLVYVGEWTKYRVQVQG